MAMTSISLLLAPTLKVDVANVTVCLGDLQQALLGYSLFLGHN